MPPCEFLSANRCSFWRLSRMCEQSVFDKKFPASQVFGSPRISMDFSSWTRFTLQRTSCPVSGSLTLSQIALSLQLWCLRTCSLSMRLETNSLSAQQCHQWFRISRSAPWISLSTMTTFVNLALHRHRFSSVWTRATLSVNHVLMCKGSSREANLRSLPPTMPSVLQEKRGKGTIKEAVGKTKKLWLMIQRLKIKKQTSQMVKMLPPRKKKSASGPKRSKHLSAASLYQKKTAPQTLLRL